MDFDLNYTFGNKSEKQSIYCGGKSEEDLEKAFQTHTAICKSISYMLEKILKEFDIEIQTVKLNGSPHMHNIVTLKNGKNYVLDLEDDLEFIQSGAKTRSFGKPVKIEDYDFFENGRKFYNIINSEKTDDESEARDMLTEEEIRDIDKNKIGYIPSGYYIEDVIWMLKKAVDSPNLDFETKLKLVLDNLEVYRNMKQVGYRERIRCHHRILEEVLEQKDYRKIHQRDCYRENEEKRKYYSCIVADIPQKERKAYLFSYKTNKYEEIEMQDLANMLKNGLSSKKQIPGMKKYLKKSDNSYGEYE